MIHLDYKCKVFQNRPRYLVLSQESNIADNQTMGYHIFDSRLSPMLAPARTHSIKGVAIYVFLVQLLMTEILEAATWKTNGLLQPFP